MTPDTPAPEDAQQRSEPENFRGRQLSVALSVNDLEASLAWYRDIVGFYVAEQYEQDDRLWAVRLEAGNVEITLNQDDGAMGTDRTKGVGMSLQITTAQDVDWLAGRIKERGGTLEREPEDQPWGRYFMVKDPDGFTYGISAEESAGG